MRSSQLLSLLAAVVCLAALIFAQPGSDTFILGTHWVKGEDGQYSICKNDLHMNCLFDEVGTSNLDSAAYLDLWLTGLGVPNTTYQLGIPGLGAHTSAGVYWACTDSMQNPYYVSMWLDTELVGENIQEWIGQDQVWVRHVDSTCQAGPMLDSLNGGFCPFYWSRLEPDGYGTHHNYYVRLFGRRIGDVGEDPAVLSIKADWMDGDSYDYHLATWNGPGSTESDTFYASELGTSWSMSDPKELSVLNPNGHGCYYWRGSLSIYWTGNCDLEIYYVTISDSVGDVTVFNPSHPSDAFIETDKYYSQLCK